MDGILEIYDEYKNIGINSRKITEGVEFELVTEFIQYRKEKFKPTSSKNLMIFIETKVNDSYPDIVFVGYNPSGYDNWNRFRTKLTKMDYKILYFIYFMKRICAENIVLQLGVSWRDTLLSIERLYDAGMIIRQRNNWCISDKRIFSVKNIQAVEAKINNLDSVIQQALINKNFASESYVLSNLNRNIDDTKLEKFNNFGIGLYSKTNQKFNLVKKSKKSQFLSVPA
jgi:hypothetical protein